MNLLQRIARQDAPARSMWDTYGSFFNFDGVSYPLNLNQTLVGSRIPPTGYGLNTYMAALKACPPAFAAEMVRSLILSQARFTFRNRRSSPTPGRLFGNQTLGLLEVPWTNATTGELLTLMEWHAGVAGNSYVFNRGTSLRVLNPAWVGVVLGSHEDPDDAINMVDAEVVGYTYQPGGYGSNASVRTLDVASVAHWKPLPDPQNPWVGMSWLTPAIREVQADRAYTEHKIQFLENGATPNLVVKGIPAVNQQQFDQYVEMMDALHAGVENAYRTLYLVAGADATVVGSDLAQMDFKATQGAGETRISVLSRVPAPILGISEGLAGSSLNAGNFGQARRNLADGWLYPTLQSVSAALASILPVPSDAELWFDTTDMPFVREDAKDLADIQNVQAQAAKALIEAGFTPDSVTSALTANDMSKLVHSGMVSVQLQPPGTPMMNGASGG